MQPVGGEECVQTRQAPTPSAAPPQDNNTTTGPLEPAKRVITQTAFNTIEDQLQIVQQFLKNTGSDKAQVLRSALEQLRDLPKLTPELQCLEKLTSMVRSIQKTV